MANWLANTVGNALNSPELNLIAAFSVYVDTARSANDLANGLVFNTDDAAGTWRIKVSQLECYNVAK